MFFVKKWLDSWTHTRATGERYACTGLVGSTDASEWKNRTEEKPRSPQRLWWQFGKYSEHFPRSVNDRERERDWAFHRELLSERWVKAGLVYWFMQNAMLALPASCLMLPYAIILCLHSSVYCIMKFHWLYLSLCWSFWICGGDGKLL